MLNFLRRKFGDVRIKNMTIEELAIEAVPNRYLHYVMVSFSVDDFHNYAFFHRGNTINLRQNAKFADSINPLWIKIKEIVPLTDMDLYQKTVSEFEKLLRAFYKSDTLTKTAGEIWAQLGLKEGDYTQREIAEYISRLQTSQLLNKVAIEASYYKRVPKKIFKNLPDDIREKTDFFESFYK